MFDKKETISIKRGYDNSLSAETQINVNGVDWVLRTFKYRRNNVYTQCDKVESNAGGGYMMSMNLGADNDEHFKLHSEQVSRLTEGKLREIHLKSLAMFDQMKDNGELPTSKDYEVKIGQIVFTDNMQFDNENRRAVYKIEKTNWGTHYHTVLLDGSDLRIDQHIENYKNKFGIGVYYREGDMFSEDKLGELVLNAHEAVNKRNELNRLEMERKNKEYNEKVAKGKEIVKIPAWAQSVIVAKLYKDDSDSMTDYFATSVEQIVILGFSRSTRNDMGELRNMCKNFEGTTEFDNKEFENRDSSGMYLPPFFLGSSRWYGWKVVKDTYLLKHQIDKIYLAAAEDRYMVKEETTSNGVSKDVTFNESGFSININEERNGIEVSFESKPETEVLDSLKVLGFRWSRFNKVWYHRNTEKNMEGLKKLFGME